MLENENLAQTSQPTNTILEVKTATLGDKITELIKKFKDTKFELELAQDEISSLRNEIVSLKAQNEAINLQILGLEDAIESKSINENEMLAQIEEVNEVLITSKSLGRSYKINLNDEFARVVEKELLPLLQQGKMLDSKTLLEAFMNKCYENYVQSQEIEKLINQIDKGV